MVYRYKRKSNQASWSEDNMRKAIEEVRSNKSTLSRAATTYNVPLGTLYRHYKNGTTGKKLGRFRPVFSNEQEIELKKYLKAMATGFYGLSISEFLEVAYHYAEANAIAHPFKNGKAGEDWLQGFRRRHPDISPRNSELTSITKAEGLDKGQVNRFYTLLHVMIERHNVDASRIYNIDEIGIGVQGLSIRRESPIEDVTTKSGQLTTVLCCCNATGSYIPPFFVFARERMLDNLLDGASPASQATFTDGTIDGFTFLTWLKFFVDNVRPTEERKVLLLVDNHESHKYFPVLEYASKNHVVFVSFPPHITHKTHPLDISVYGSLKMLFEQELSSFQEGHVESVVNQRDAIRIFSAAYLKATNVHNTVKGFEMSGIWPYNPQVFNENDFLTASIGNQQ